MKVTVDIELEDVLDEAKWDEISFKEEFAKHLTAGIVNELRERCEKAILKQVQQPITDKVEEVASEAAKEILSLDRSQKFKFRYNYSEYEMTVDEFIKMYFEHEAGKKINDIIKSNAKDFVDEMRKRYDMTFAALIVDNMRKQNLLADERLAELIAPNNK